MLAKIETYGAAVKDLLGRSQTVLDGTPVRSLIAGRRVMITGAGGSIGSEIVRQVSAIGPAALCLVDSSEFNLYTIDIRTAETAPAIERSSRVLDIRHRASVHSCFMNFKPDIVFHAAALKHVPLVEENPVEGIWTNVVGTRHVCDAAILARCRTVMLISTDKAVYPSSIMGATKRAAEGYCQALALGHIAESTATRFLAVRFGNVLGSTGSVVPLFERQIRAGGPITVTHPDMERYFMTMHEAVQLVLQAAALGTTTVGVQGRIFTLDMGQPIKIVDLAHWMIRIAGLRPDIDIALEFIGLRPGEKLTEDLLHNDERVEPMPIQGINIITPRSIGLGEVSEILDRLEEACIMDAVDRAIDLLKALVPEFQELASMPIATLERAIA